jgi:murein DD-endopeptidase MepM/ murein hydrolase activator NlpD
VKLELTGQENVRADRALPSVATVPAGNEQTILVLQRADGASPWSYRYRWSWTPGSYEARPDPRFDYTLPYAPGYAFQVGERLDDDPSHRHAQAIDWRMPAGTPVSAARGGTVARIASDPDQQLRILHEDGTIGCYRGLQDLRVRLGDRVAAGDALGVVAGPGGSGEPHLHFHVFRATREGTRVLVPLTFATREGSGVALEIRGVYMRPHADVPPGGGEWPLNAVQSMVTCRRVDRDGHPLDETNRFGREDVVHVHVSFGAPDIYPIQIDFLREGQTKPKSIRRFPSRPEWDGVHVTLDLGGVDEPEGHWIVETRVGGIVQKRAEFRVD